MLMLLFISGNLNNFITGLVWFIAATETFTFGDSGVGLYNFKTTSILLVLTCFRFCNYPLNSIKKETFMVKSVLLNLFVFQDETYYFHHLWPSLQENIVRP